MNMCVAVVGCQVTKIGLGWVVMTPRGRYRAQALGTAWPSKGQGGLCRGSVCGSFNAWFEVVGDRDAKIGWGWVVLTPRGRYRA